MELLRGCTVACSVVLSMYLWRTPREAFLLAVRSLPTAARRRPGEPGYFDREDPREISKRIVSLCAVSALYLALLRHRRRESFGHLLLGTDKALLSHIFSSVCTGVGLMATLWLGPLLEAPVSFAGHLRERLIDCKSDPVSELRYLVAAPITEEILFRLVMCEVFSECSVVARLFATTALFSLAHVHLVVNQAVLICRELLAANICGADEAAICNEAVRHAWEREAAQVLVCSVYGGLSMWLFEAVFHRNVVSAMISHSFCNFVGAPELKCMKHSSSWSIPRRCAAFALHVGGVGLFIATATRLSSAQRVVM